MMRIRGIKSALLAAAMFISAAAVASVEFKSGDAVLRLSEKNGAVESLFAAGLERVVPAAEAFTLQLLDDKGEPTRLKSSEFVFEWSAPKISALLQIVDASLPSVAATRPNTALALLGRARPAGHPAARIAARGAVRFSP